MKIDFHIIKKADLPQNYRNTDLSVYEDLFRACKTLLPDEVILIEMEKTSARDRYNSAIKKGLPNMKFHVGQVKMNNKFYAKITRL